MMPTRILLDAVITAHLTTNTSPRKMTVSEDKHYLIEPNTTMWLSNILLISDAAHRIHTFNTYLSILDLHV